MARPLVGFYHTDVVLRAMALLKQRGHTCVCDIAGRGPERDKLEMLAEELNLSSEVAFHGHLPESEVELMIARGDVYVSVAESDGASIALLEAMALGAVPVVADIPANRFSRHYAPPARLH